MKLGIAGLATTLLVSGGLGLAAGSALADDQPHWGPPCPTGQTCGLWCPGDSTMHVTGVQWDWGVCHEYAYEAAGIVDVGNGEVVYPWPSGPIPPATPVPGPPVQCAIIFFGPPPCGI
jgi:hypothetical protein